MVNDLASCDRKGGDVKACKDRVEAYWSLVSNRQNKTMIAACNPNSSSYSLSTCNADRKDAWAYVTDNRVRSLGFGASSQAALAEAVLSVNAGNKVGVVSEALGGLPLAYGSTPQSIQKAQDDKNNNNASMRLYGVPLNQLTDPLQIQTAINEGSGFVNQTLANVAHINNGDKGYADTQNDLYTPSAEESNRLNDNPIVFTVSEANKGADKGIINIIPDTVNGITDTVANIAHTDNDYRVNQWATYDNPAQQDGSALGQGTVNLALTVGGIAMSEITAANQAANAAKAIEQAEIDKAKIEAGANADNFGLGNSATRDFQAGATHRAENINAGQVTDRDGLQRVDDAKTANDQQVKEVSKPPTNYWATGRPAWKEGTTVTDRVTTKTETVNMVVNKDAYDKIVEALRNRDTDTAVNNLGGWATPDPIKTVGDVRNNLAISSEWKGQGGQQMYSIQIEVQPGAKIRQGTVGYMWDKETGTRLPGGGQQIQFMDNLRTNPNLIKIDLSKSVEIKP